MPFPSSAGTPIDITGRGSTRKTQAEDANHAAAEDAGHAEKSCSRFQLVERRVERSVAHLQHVS